GVAVQEGAQGNAAEAKTGFAQEQSAVDGRQEVVIHVDIFSVVRTLRVWAVGTRSVPTTLEARVVRARRQCPAANVVRTLRVRTVSTRSVPTTLEARVVRARGRCPAANEVRTLRVRMVSTRSVPTTLGLSGRSES